MKYYIPFFVTILGFQICMAQADANFLKTPSGLLYKIHKGNSTAETREGDVLKMNVVQRLSGHKDTLLTSTYGKMPAFVKINPSTPGQPKYGPDELFKELKPNDSLTTVMFVDSLIAKGIAAEKSLPPFIQKGDKITFTFKVINVFKIDSLAQADYEKEMERDAPRAEKERKEMMQKMRNEKAAAERADDDELRKSGEMTKQIQHVENYLKAKGIKHAKTPLGSFVKTDTPGTGGKIVDGKYVTIKYTAKIMDSDSTFDANTFTLQTGEDRVIRGFEDGIKMFQKGGKGSIYIPGYLAYGKENPPIFGPYEPLIFDIEILDVNDKNPDKDEEMADPPPARDELKEKIRATFFY